MRPGGGGQSQRNQERTNEPALRSAMIANRTGWQPTRHQQQCDAPRQHAGPGDLPRPTRSRAEVGPRDALHGAGAHGPDTARVCSPDCPHSLTPVRWRGASDLKAPSLIPGTQSPLIATLEELGRRASSPGDRPVLKPVGSPAARQPGGGGSPSWPRLAAGRFARGDGGPHCQAAEDLVAPANHPKANLLRIEGVGL